jgi:hypothetical protein
MAKPVGEIQNFTASLANIVAWNMRVNDGRCGKVSATPVALNGYFVLELWSYRSV